MLDARTTKGAMLGLCRIISETTLGIETAAFSTFGLSGVSVRIPHSVGTILGACYEVVSPSCVAHVPARSVKSESIPSPIEAW